MLRFKGDNLLMQTLHAYIVVVVSTIVITYSGAIALNILDMKSLNFFSRLYILKTLKWISLHLWVNICGFNETCPWRDQRPTTGCVRSCRLILPVSLCLRKQAGANYYTISKTATFVVGKSVLEIIYRWNKQLMTIFLSAATRQGI